MKTFWPSASKLWIADQCGFPWGPLRPDWPAKSTYIPKPEARVGTAFHRCADLLVCEAGYADDYGAEISRLDRLDPEVVDIIAKQEGVPPSGASKVKAMIYHFIEEFNARPWIEPKSEVSILFHMYTYNARLADESILEHRKPPGGQMASILDLVGIGAESHRLRVRDYKTGYTASQTPLSKDWQLRAGALSAARLYGATEVRLERATYYDDRRPSVEVEDIDTLEIGIITEELRALLFDRIPKATLPILGPACKSCPVVSVCPHTLDMNARVKFAGDEVPLFPIQDPPHAARLHQRVTLLESATKRWRAELSEYATNMGGIEIGPGRWYGPKDVDGSRSVDMRHPSALPILKKYLKEETLPLALELSTSQASIKHAIQMGGGDAGESKTSDFRKLWGDLTEAGAVTRGAPSVRVQEHTRKPQGKNSANDNDQE